MPDTKAETLCINKDAIMLKTFTHLIEMQEEQCKQYALQRLYGTKKNNQYQWINYKELADEINVIRGGLSAHQLKPGDKLGIISPNSTEWVITAFAALGLAATIIPMYPNQRIDDWIYILNNAEVSICCVSTYEIYHQLKSEEKQLPFLKTIIVFEEKKENDITTFNQLRQTGKDHPIGTQNITPDTVAQIIYTSGTTSNPKGVVLCHSQIINKINNIYTTMNTMLDEFNISSMHTLSFLPWAHIFGNLMEVYFLIAIGGSSCLVKDTNDIAKDLPLAQPNVMYVVPRLLNRIYSGISNKIAKQPKLIRQLFNKGLVLSQKKFSHESLTVKEKMMLFLAERILFKPIHKKFGGKIRFMLSGASALSQEVVSFMHNIDIPVYEGYGTTETCAATTVNTKQAYKIGSVGQPLPGVNITINTSQSSNANEGEIIVSGNSNMMSYYELPEKTQEVLSNDTSYKTGDLGYLDDDNFLFITGRVSDHFKLENGKFVSPAPIEEHIKLLNEVNQALIYGYNKPHTVAILVIEPNVIKKWLKKNKIKLSINQALTHTQLVDHIKTLINNHCTSFKSYEIPEKIILSDKEWTIENNCLTPTLKIKRQNIVDKFTHHINREYNNMK